MSPEPSPPLKTVVIVSGQAFPPVVSANAHRILALAKYLPQFGWKPIIVTLPLDFRPPQERDLTLLQNIPVGTDVRRVAPLLLRRMPARVAGSLELDGGGGIEGQIREAVASCIRTVKNRVVVPDARLFWVPKALHEIHRMWDVQRFDAVLTTSRENSNHLVGWRASVALGIPWVADLQDPWTSSWDVATGPLSRWVNRRLASLALKATTHVTVVSPSIGRSLGEYEVPSERISVVTNGFHPEEEGRLDQPPRRDGRLRIVHTGRFYGRRSPKPFLEAVQRLAKMSPSAAKRLEVRFVGGFDRAVLEDIAPYRAAPWLKLIPPVTHEEALSHQKEADLLLLIPGDGWDALPGKMFEYLSVGKPLLALCAPATDTAQFVHQLRAGLVLNPKEVGRISDLLLGLISGVESFDLPRDFFHRVRVYSWESLVRRMAGVLEDAAGKHAS